MGPEAKIEAAVCQYAKKLGALSYKFVSPARRSVPDRIFFYRGRTWLIEFKAPGKRATGGQEREMKRLRDQDIPVFVCDETEAGKDIIVREMFHAK